jgi:hypothetical protein
MPEVLQLTNDASVVNNDEPDLSIFENKTGLADDLKYFFVVFQIIKNKLILIFSRQILGVHS